MLIREVSPSSQEKFLLNSPIQKTDQLKASQPLAVIANKEAILLTKIQQLEEQLKQIKAENEKLKIRKQKAEALAQQEKQRADNYQQQLKIIIKSLYQ